MLCATAEVTCHVRAAGRRSERRRAQLCMLCSGIRGPPARSLSMHHSISSNVCSAHCCAESWRSAVFPSAGAAHDGAVAAAAAPMTAQAARSRSLPAALLLLVTKAMPSPLLGSGATLGRRAGRAAACRSAASSQQTNQQAHQSAARCDRLPDWQFSPAPTACVVAGGSWLATHRRGSRRDEPTHRYPRRRPQRRRPAAAAAHGTLRTAGAACGMSYTLRSRSPPKRGPYYNGAAHDDEALTEAQPDVSFRLLLALLERAEAAAAQRGAACSNACVVHNLPIAAAPGAAWMCAASLLDKQAAWRQAACLGNKRTARLHASSCSYKEADTAPAVPGAAESSPNKQPVPTQPPALAQKQRTVVAATALQPANPHREHRRSSTHSHSSSGSLTTQERSPAAAAASKVSRARSAGLRGSQSAAILFPTSVHAAADSLCAAACSSARSPAACAYRPAKRWKSRQRRCWPPWQAASAAGGRPLQDQTTATNRLTGWSLPCSSSFRLSAACCSGGWCCVDGGSSTAVAAVNGERTAS